jgi:COMPASS component SWD3
MMVSCGMDKTVRLFEESSDDGSVPAEEDAASADSNMRDGSTPADDADVDNAMTDASALPSAAATPAEDVMMT